MAEMTSDGRRFTGFIIEGHSGLADAGFDIVCAAISALSQAAVIGLTEVVGASPDWERSNGRLSVHLDRETAIDPGVSVLLETVYLAMEDLADQYSDRLDLKIIYSTERGR